jgi:serine/threonine protein kinase
VALDEAARAIHMHVAQGDNATDSRHSHQSSASRSGARLGPYEILKPLGAGGMGEVYSARDTRLGRTVALKILTGGMLSRSGIRGRFEREARAISSLNHPNICTLFDIGPATSSIFL